MPDAPQPEQRRRRRKRRLQRRATKAYEEDPAAYAELLSGYFNLDPELIAQAGSKYNYVLAFSDSDVEGLQDTVTFLLNIGAVQNGITVKDYVADDIAKEVIAESAE